jgi:hypothetical protein
VKLPENISQGHGIVFKCQIGLVEEILKMTISLVDFERSESLHVV